MATLYDFSTGQTQENVTPDDVVDFVTKKLGHSEPGNIHGEIDMQQTMNMHDWFCVATAGGIYEDKAEQENAAERFAIFILHKMKWNWKRAPEGMRKIALGHFLALDTDTPYSGHFWRNISKMDQRAREIKKLAGGLAEELHQFDFLVQCQVELLGLASAEKRGQDEVFRALANLKQLVSNLNGALDLVDGSRPDMTAYAQLREHLMCNADDME